MQYGIVGYGSYIPRLRIKVEEIAKVWGDDAQAIKDGLGINEKSVPEMDEDTITISVEAARNALMRAKAAIIDFTPEQIDGVYVGSESHPYVVKPSGATVAEAIGATPNVSVVDTEFACRAGTSSIQICLGLTKSGQARYALAIGADTSQGKPGDALEYTAAAGGAAFIIGPDPIATIDAWHSFVTDTPDFWRREGQKYPSHGGRFTGEPAYFHHVVSATKALLEKTKTKISDYKYVAFHTPNGKFPQRAAKLLGVTNEQMVHSLIVKHIGNTYSGASMLALSNILDHAKAGDKILICSYGSGAGSDAFSLTVTEKINNVKNVANQTSYYIDKKDYIDYGKYLKHTGGIHE